MSVNYSRRPPNSYNFNNSPTPLGIGVKFGTFEHTNDFLYMIRNVAKTENNCAFYYTFELPSGPPITPGTLCDIRLWAEGSCYYSNYYLSNYTFV
jgi:hypothetical protein